MFLVGWVQECSYDLQPPHQGIGQYLCGQIYIAESAGQMAKNVRLFDSEVGLLIQLKNERLSNGQLQDPS